MLRNSLIYLLAWLCWSGSATMAFAQKQDSVRVSGKARPKETPKKEKWHLEWTEGFEHFDPGMWNAKNVFNSGGSTGYSPSNVRTDNGHLVLTLSDEPYMEKPYTGAEVFSIKEIAYGRVDIKMRLPKGAGIAAGFIATSTLGTGRRSHDEISILFRGSETQSVRFDYFKNKPRPENGNSYFLPFDVSDEFHVYSIERTHKYIKWYIDGQLYYQTYERIPASALRLVFTIWHGGGLKKEGEQESLPATLLVDYVKYFTRNN